MERENNLLKQIIRYIIFTFEFKLWPISVCIYTTLRLNYLCTNYIIYALIVVCYICQIFNIPHVLRNKPITLFGVILLLSHSRCYFKAKHQRIPRYTTNWRLHRQSTVYFLFYLYNSIRGSLEFCLRLPTCTNR